MAKILIVDDDRHVRAVYARILSEAGFKVETARDGLEGVQVYRDIGANLVIVDIIMPEQEGLETIRQLRRLNADLKIVAISGGGRIDPADYLSLAETFGADLSLAKPIDPALLLEKVHELLVAG